MRGLQNAFCGENKLVNWCHEQDIKSIWLLNKWWAAQKNVWRGLKWTCKKNKMVLYVDFGPIMLCSQFLELIKYLLMKKVHVSCKYSK